MAEMFFCDVSCGNADTFVLSLTDRQKISYSLVNTTWRNCFRELWGTDFSFTEKVTELINETPEVTICSAFRKCMKK